MDSNGQLTSDGFRPSAGPEQLVLLLEKQGQSVLM
jgi:hypothetical protein